jgi:hypothetical protein
MRGEPPKTPAFAARFEVLSTQHNLLVTSVLMHAQVFLAPSISEDIPRRKWWHRTRPTLCRQDSV